MGKTRKADSFLVRHISVPFFREGSNDCDVSLERSGVGCSLGSLTISVPCLLQIARVKAYSHSLRTQIISALDRQEGSPQELARRFGVSGSFVYGLLNRRRTGF